MSYITVLIHDSTPFFQPEVEGLVNILNSYKVFPRSMLIVPCWEGRAPSEYDNRFIDLIEKEKKNGIEFLLHGFHHNLPPSNNLTALLHRMYHNTSGYNKEFKNLDARTAKDKIEQGLEMLQRFSISPKGFVAPAWRLSDKANDAVKSLGFEFLPSRDYVEDLKTSERYPSKEVWTWPCIWDLFHYPYNKMLFAIHKDDELVRIALHPPNIRQSRNLGFLLQVMSQLMQERELVTLEDYINSKRNSQ